MPTGIVMSSSSAGATQEDVEKVLTANGYEPDKPLVNEVEQITEPKRDDFESDEDFEAAQEEFTASQEAAEEERALAEEEKEEEKKPKLTRSQRIAARATRELQAELRKANERIAALEGGSGEKKTAAVKEPEKPKRDAFKSDEEFDEAMFEWRYKVRRAKEQAEEQANAMQNALKQNFANYQSAVEDFKETHDDWDEVVSQPIPIHESVYFAIHELPNGPAVTYYLGKHPAVAKKLHDEMSPFAAVMEVGRLAARLKTGASEPGAADTRTKQKPKPKLPEPVKPVSTAATASTLTSKEAAKKRDYRAFKTAQARGV